MCSMSVGGGIEEGARGARDRPARKMRQCVARLGRGTLDVRAKSLGQKREGRRRKKNSTTSGIAQPGSHLQVDTS